MIADFTSFYMLQWHAFYEFICKPLEKIFFRSWDIQVFLRALSLKKPIFCDFWDIQVSLTILFVLLEIFIVNTFQIGVLAEEKWARIDELLSDRSKPHSVWENYHFSGFCASVDFVDEPYKRTDIIATERSHWVLTGATNF